MSGDHAFIDETKSPGLVVVAAVLSSAQVGGARSAMRGLLLGNQTHLHFTKERPPRRREIARTVLGCGLQVDVYDAVGLRSRDARDACLEHLVSDPADARAAWLWIEKDDSLARAERSVIARALRKHGAEGRLQYAHVPKRSEPLLWAADAAAWCWTHPDAREWIRPAVRTVRRLR